MLLCARVCGCLCARVHVYSEDGGQGWAFIFSHQDTVSSSLECAKWAGMASEPRGSSLSPPPPPSTGITGMYHHTWEPTQALRLMEQALHRWTQPQSYKQIPKKLFFFLKVNLKFIHCHQKF